MEKIINTQKEFDKIKSDFSGRIVIKDTKESIYVNRSFDNAYISVSDNATIESVSDNATIKSVYGNATIISVYGNATIISVSDNATIISVSDNATIISVSDNATIESVSDNATIISVSDNATIISVSDNATIESVSDNATIESVSDNATIKSVYGNATILLFGMACICFLYNAKKVTSLGINMIRQIGTSKIDMKLSKETSFIQIKEELSLNKNPKFETYKKIYPTEEQNKKIIMYKAVHKSKDGEYYSNYNNSFKYIIGETKEEVCSKNQDDSCSQGIHISHKLWALKFGREFENMALLECEVDEKDIVVSRDCDGKVRASKIKVLREVPKSEY